MTIIDSKCTICGFMVDTPNHEIGCGAHVHDELCTATRMTRGDGTTFYLGECSCELLQEARYEQDQRWCVWIGCVTTRMSTDDAMTTLQNRALKASHMSMDEVVWARSLRPAQ